MPDIPDCLKIHTPWAALAIYLNSMVGPSIQIDTKLPIFPARNHEMLPDDLLIRGLAWAQSYYPPGFFDTPGRCDELRFEIECHRSTRVDRCLVLGCKIASLGRSLIYDDEAKHFTANNL